MATYFVQDKNKIHDRADITAPAWDFIEPSNTEKCFIVQEREVSYRITLHQHPYIQKLTQRLLTGGTPGLQAADTDFVPGNEARPGSVEFMVGKTTVLTIPAGARVALRNKVIVIVNHTPYELAANLAFVLSASSTVKVPNGLRATLIGGMNNLPTPGSEFTLHNDSTAIIRGNTLIVLNTSASIVLTGGILATLPVGTELALADGTEIPLPNGTPFTLIRFKRKPDLYDKALGLYDPTRKMVQHPYAVKDLDFSYGGAYSAYNWELFFHVPMMVAIHLGKNQRFAEAQRWFHFLFDPTDSSEGPTPERFWKVLPFQTVNVKKVEEILVNLVTGGDPDLREETIHSINAWKAAPFRPHVIARYRQQAYMIKTVMAYLDNLIAWGDSLFRQDTGEAVDEALMLYVLAANILGPRPQPVPTKGSIRPQTYHNLREDLTHFGSVLRTMEADAPFDLAPLPPVDSGDGSGLATVRSLGRALYFCVPRNDKLLGYWDTVADRLFKIRNSLNIQGTFRQLALFEPPIDPAMLARAAAAGLDVSAIINGLNQPLPLVRFQLLLQKASEVVQEVKSLGNSLLSAMEKEDGEAMAILRAKHERVIMEMVEQVRYSQLQEAIKSKEGTLQSLALAVQRYTYYERQLGRKADEIEKSVPELDELDKDSLGKMKFLMLEPSSSLREIEFDIATDVTAQAAQMLNGGKLLSSHEVHEAFLLEGAQLSSDIANIMNFMGSIGYIFPNFKTHGQPMGVGGTVEWGGKNIGDGLAATAAAARSIADRLNFEARRANRVDSFSRRERDWAFQSNLAVGEINQIFKQLRAAQIREAIAVQELKSHRQQMKHAEEIERFLNEEGTEKTGKKTNKALYTWMKREVKGLYAQCFQFGFDIAKKAERALQHELGDPSLTYIQFSYLAGKEGLLAGEKLYFDLKRMEMAYHDLNQREYELIKHVSLLQVDPLALIKLRATGRCTVKVPEAIFDMDGPGHYFRRVKSVAVSIPSVTGPYASVNCTLTLLRSSIRKTPALGDQYTRIDAEDSRFSDHFGSLQSIVTSSAQNDSGLFETNLRDERYLPFENSGVISEWQLQLPADPSKKEPAQFDYNTISDVILHIRYTAREGGEILRKGAMDNLKNAISEGLAAGSVRLFSVRHEFPNEWARFQSQPATNQHYELALKLGADHYPFWSQGHLEAVKGVIILARSTLDSVNVLDFDDVNKKDTLAKGPLYGNLLFSKLENVNVTKVIAKPEGDLRIIFDTKSVSDLWIAVLWGSNP